MISTEKSIAGSRLPEWWLSKPGQVAQWNQEYSDIGFFIDHYILFVKPS
jgi:hypothetical protein